MSLVSSLSIAVGATQSVAADLGSASRVANVRRAVALVSGVGQVHSSEVIHPSVRMRRMQDPTYDPPALRGFNLHYDAAHSRWIWTKKWTDDNGAVREKFLEEDRIQDSYFSMLKVGSEMLKFRADEEEPIPPKPKSGWRFWT